MGAGGAGDQGATTSTGPASAAARSRVSCSSAGTISVTSPQAGQRRVAKRA
ncbi:hypothetical protein HFP43_21080 [Streptomyces sp. SJ1-7]|nr:hypothetical protein [Streptomyces sp. SJ1-7]